MRHGGVAAIRFAALNPGTALSGAARAARRRQRERRSETLRLFVRAGRGSEMV
jgi:hypothetical protein